jgi:hypothetical protein
MGSQPSRKGQVQQPARRALLPAVTMAIVALVMAGCVSAPALVRALGEDPASVCISVTTIYGKGAACRIGNAAEVKAGDGAISLTAK